ncbi:MAG TPA: ORF6N domain-containing protein [Tepidisphaeraceae bacterium]|nr:ORF6N domain-containing protein [Tepidisphaeraceae bacterium]
MKRQFPSLAIIPHERIEQRIYLFRGQKVMLSIDLAELYGVPVRQLNQAVKRNLDRFPADFMFQLTRQETKLLRSQSVILESRQHFKYLPYAFTEEGVAMLSAILHSPTAVQVSIQIMRVFVRLRQLLASNDQLRKRLVALERTMVDHNQKFAAVFDAIRQLMDEPKQKRKPPVGYHTEGHRAKR